MGIGLNALQFLQLARHTGVDFSHTLVLGRQGMHITKPSARQFYHKIHAPDMAARIDRLLPWDFCEDFLKKLYGAHTVDSMDASDYEQATLIHDLNFPYPSSKEYSFVYDAGCTEHVFNIPQALSTISALTATGGHIAHSVPANNYMGHGFYQFSPELFFNLYTEARGFKNTRVFLVEVAAPDTWYEVISPQILKARVDVVNRCDLEMIVLTQKSGPVTSVFLSPPQQSDYSSTWNKDDTMPVDWRIGVRKRLKGWLDVVGIAEFVRSKKNTFPLSLMWRPAKLSKRRHDMRQFNICDMLRKAR